MSFNLNDAYESKLLEYAEDKEAHGDFAKFIKRLISMHYEGQRFIPEPAQGVAAVPVIDNSEDIDAMHAMI